MQNSKVNEQTNASVLFAYQSRCGLRNQEASSLRKRVRCEQEQASQSPKDVKEGKKKTKTHTQNENVAVFPWMLDSRTKPQGN